MPRLGRKEDAPLRRNMATVVASRPRLRSGSWPAPRRCSWSVFQLMLSTPSSALTSTNLPSTRRIPYRNSRVCSTVDAVGEDGVCGVGGRHRRTSESDDVAVTGAQRVLNGRRATGIRP